MKSRELPWNLKIKSWRKCIPRFRWWIIKMANGRAKIEANGNSCLRMNTPEILGEAMSLWAKERGNKLNMVILTIRTPCRAFPPSCRFPIALRYGDALTCDISWPLASDLQQSYIYGVWFFHVSQWHVKFMTEYSSRSKIYCFRFSMLRCKQISLKIENLKGKLERNFIVNNLRSTRSRIYKFITDNSYFCVTLKYFN